MVGCSLPNTNRADSMCASLSPFIFSRAFSCCWRPVFFPCQIWKRDAGSEGESIRKKQGQFQTAQRRGSELVFLQGGPTCHGSRKAEQTQLPLSLLFVHARSVFVRVGVCNTESWRRMEDVLYVSLDLHEHSLDNGTDQKHSVTETLSHTELTPTHHVNHIFP